MGESPTAGKSGRSPKTVSLIDRSKAGRRFHERPTVYGDPISSGYAQREKRQILALARTAASMAAAERKRHGRKVSPEAVADAAQDVLVAVYAESERPNVADLTDAENPSISTPDGERITGRPAAALVKVAGATLDAEHSEPLAVDPLAGDGALLVASEQSRDGAESKRSVATQVLDPTISPLPAEVLEAMQAARLWPDDALRQIISDRLAPELTAEDWIEAGAPAPSPAAIRKRRERGSKADVLHSPAAQDFATHLEPLIAPTPEELEVLAADWLGRAIAGDPYGSKPQAAKLIDPAWRTTQPCTYALVEVTL